MRGSGIISALAVLASGLGLGRRGKEVVARPRVPSPEEYFASLTEHPGHGGSRKGSARRQRNENRRMWEQCVPDAYRAKNRQIEEGKGKHGRSMSPELRARHQAASKSKEGAA